MLETFRKFSILISQKTVAHVISSQKNYVVIYFDEVSAEIIFIFSVFNRRFVALLPVPQLLHVYPIFTEKPVAFALLIGLELKVAKEMRTNVPLDRMAVQRKRTATTLWAHLPVLVELDFWEMAKSAIISMNVKPEVPIVT